MGFNWRQQARLAHAAEFGCSDVCQITRLGELHGLAVSVVD